jgi:hypothetical protein
MYGHPASAAAVASSGRLANISCPSKADNGQKKE